MVSELRRPDHAAAPVRAWADRTPATPFRLSAITQLEFELGIMRLERRGAAQGTQLRRCP